jgi:hypothetical protein
MEKKPDFVSPSINELGSVAELTQDIPKYSKTPSDGFSFNGNPLNS